MQVSGLMTGLDTQSIVQQLMSVERSGGTRLTVAKANADATVKALTNLNGLVKAMGDAGKAFTPDLITGESAWTASSAATSNNGLATAATVSGARAGALTFMVDRLATAGSVISGKSWGSATESLGNSNPVTFSLTQAGKTTAVSLAGGATIADAAAAINATDAGINATVVQVAGNTYRLQLTSNATGAASNISMQDGTGLPGASELLGSMNLLYNGVDAQITVGQGANAYAMTSNSNTFKGVMQGVDVTAVKADSATPVTVSVASSVDAMSDKVKAMVDAANAVITNVNSNSKLDPSVKYDPTKVSGIPLAGVGEARDLANRIVNVFVGSTASSPAMAGVSVARDGSITFDKEKFNEAYTNDPSAVRTAITKAGADLADVSRQASNSGNGYLTHAIDGKQAASKDYTSQITRFNDRMDLREATLQQQYNALDAMLSKLKSQGDWLAGQLKSLPDINSKN